MYVSTAIPVVVDTNILVPSLYSYTPIARFIYDGNLILVWNNFLSREALEIIEELSNGYLKRDIPSERAVMRLEYFKSIGIKVPEMPVDWPPVATDRDDDNFLWVAISGRAEYIISEDHHLRNLGAFRGIPIGMPGSFFKWAAVAHPM